MVQAQRQPPSLWGDFSLFNLSAPPLTQVHEVIAGRVWRTLAAPPGGRGAAGDPELTSGVSADPSAMPALVSPFPWQMPGAAAAVSMARQEIAAAAVAAAVTAATRSQGQQPGVTQGAKGSIGDDRSEGKDTGAKGGGLGSLAAKTVQQGGIGGGDDAGGGGEDTEEARAWLAAESAGLVYEGLQGRCKSVRHALRRLQERVEAAREEVDAATGRVKAEIRGAKGRLGPAESPAVQTLLGLR